MPGGYGSAYKGSTPGAAVKPGGFGSAYHADFGSPVAVAPPEPKHVGLLTALGHDVGGAITGFVPGVTQLVEHPVRTAQQIGHAEYQTWAPFVSTYKDLFTGDLKGYRENAAKFNAQFYAHPLAPITDLLAVVGLGAARVGALSTLPKEASLGQVGKAALTGRTVGPLRTITGKLGENAAPVTLRVLPRNAYRAGRMTITDAALKRLMPADNRLLGEYARAARAVNREAIPVQLRHLFNPVTQQYFRTFAKLNPRERVALGIMQRWPLPADAARVLANLDRADAGDTALATALRDPRIHADYLDPTPNMLAAHEAGRAVTDLREKILLGRGAISPETVAEAPYRQIRAARAPTGTEIVRNPETGVVMGYRQAGSGSYYDLQRALDQSQTVLRGEQKRLETLERRLARPNPQGRPIRRPKLEARTVRQRERVAEWRSQVAQDEHRMNQEGPQLIPVPAAADLRAEIEAAGRPLPYYVKDVMTDKPGPYLGGEMGGGLSPQRAGADVYQSHAVLQNLGHMILHPDVIGPAFLRAAKHDFYMEKYNLVRDHAISVPKGSGLPAGHRWVRRVRGETIPYVETQLGEHTAQANEAFQHLPEHQDFVLSKAEDALGDGTLDDLVATDAKGNRLAVPESFAKGVSGEFNRASDGIQKWINNPLRVWRAAILNLRIPWLENNILGNGLMAGIRMAGPGALPALLSMILHTKGVEAARAALGMAKAEGLDADFMARNLPELSRGGTFIGTQLPTGISAQLPERLQKAAKVPGKVLGFLPSIDRATEGALRRASAEAFLRHQPEVRRILNTMPKQERSFRAAAEKALNDHPDLRRLTVREVNDALGDYLSMSKFERDFVRQAVPFYGWFREITRITAKLAIDTPGRADLLAKVGQIGSEWANAQTGPLPSFLQGFLPTGPQGETQTGLALRSTNPYTSFLDVAKSGLAFTPFASRSGASSLLGEINPFISGGFDYLSQVQHGNVKPGAGLLTAMAQPLSTQLPEVRLFTNPPSKLYPGRTREDLVRQFFGDPRRRLSPQQAYLYSAQGR